jgi:murein DD-endopeptidase MepM/ murein hydrolase activator NlpD
MKRILLLVPVLIVLVVVGAFWLAGRAAAPVIQVHQPAKLVGIDTMLDVSIEAPRGRFSRVEARLEQNGRSFPLFTLSTPAEATVKQETPDRIRIQRPMGRRALPDLVAGAARLVVTAARRTPLPLRTRETRVVRDLQVRLTPPRISVVSTYHYINHGGAEMVVYRVGPPDSESGVRVGELVYPGYPASATGVTNADPGLKVAFFALLYDQDLNTPIELYARDEAGNQSRAQFDYRVFEKSFQRSPIELTDAFLQRVVPDIVEHTPELKIAIVPGESLLPPFLKINGDLRRSNAEKIRSFADVSAPRMLWSGPFRQLGNSQVEAKFADHRTYFYQGKEVDQQVHLGFDLAVTANIPVLAGNDGKVVWADYLGIYGTCIIIDHGLGVQSLYGHLSSIDVKAGDTVQKNQVLGRSGMTGLAGGDHLHFSVQVQGHPVSPVEWWDPHWIEDRIMRKIREASASQSAPPAAQEPGR